MSNYIATVTNTRTHEVKTYLTKSASATIVSQRVLGIRAAARQIGVTSEARPTVNGTTYVVTVTREDHEMESARMASVDTDLIAKLKARIASAEVID